MVQEEIPASVSVITEITDDETLTCDLWGHGDHSHGIEYSTCEVIPTEYFLNEFAGPFETVRTDLKQLQTDRDELRGEIAQTQEALKNVPEQIAERLEKSLSAEAPFFQKMRELNDEHIKAVDQRIQGQNAELKRQSDAIAKRLPELDAKIGDELKFCYQAVQRQEEFSQKIQNLLKEFQHDLAELREKNGDIDRRLAELRTASDKGDDAESNEEWRKKTEEKLDSLEAAVRRLQGGTPCPPPAPKRGFRRWLCDLFRHRK